MDINNINYIKKMTKFEDELLDIMGSQAEFTSSDLQGVVSVIVRNIYTAGTKDTPEVDTKIKDLEAPIKFDLNSLTDRYSTDFKYHYDLLKGNIIDLFKFIKGAK